MSLPVEDSSAASRGFRDATRANNERRACWFRHDAAARQRGAGLRQSAACRCCRAAALLAWPLAPVEQL